MRVFTTFLNSNYRKFTTEYLQVHICSLDCLFVKDLCSSRRKEKAPVIVLKKGKKHTHTSGQVLLHLIRGSRTFVITITAG